MFYRQLKEILCVNFFSAMLLILCFMTQKLLHLFHIRAEILTYIFAVRFFPRSISEKEVIPKEFLTNVLPQFSNFSGR